MATWEPENLQQDDAFASVDSFGNLNKAPQPTGPLLSQDQPNPAPAEANPFPANVERPQAEPIILGPHRAENPVSPPPTEHSDIPAAPLVQPPEDNAPQSSDPFHDLNQPRLDLGLLEDHAHDPDLQGLLQYSNDPQQALQRLSNMDFLSRKFGLPIDSSTYPVARNLYSKINFNLTEPNDAQFHQSAAKAGRQEAEIQAQLGAFRQAVSVAKLDEMSGGTPATPEAFIPKYLAAHPELANSSDRSKILGQLTESYQQENAWLSKNAPIIREIAGSARDSENFGGAKETQITPLAGILSKAAPEDQRKILEAVAAYTDAHPDQRGYVQRLFDQAYRGTTQTVNSIDRLKQEQSLEREEAHLKAQLRNGGAASPLDTALAAGRAWASDGAIAGATELARQDLPLTKIPARLREIDQERKAIQAERTMNYFLDERLNSNQAKDGGVIGVAKQAGIDTADQAHVLLLIAAGPLGEGSALYAVSARSADQLKAQHPRMSTDAALLVGSGMALGQFLLNRFEAAKLLRSFPLTARLLKNVARLSWWKQLAVHEGINLFGVAAGNEIGLLIDAFSRELADAITGDTEQGEEAGSFVQTQQHLATLSGLLGLSGLAGRATQGALAVSSRYLGPYVTQAVKGVFSKMLSQFSTRGKNLINDDGASSEEAHASVQNNHEIYPEKKKKDLSKPETPAEKLARTAKYQYDLIFHPPVTPPARSKYLKDALDTSKLDAPTKLVFKRILPMVDYVLNTNGYPHIPVDNNFEPGNLGEFKYSKWIDKNTGDVKLTTPDRIGIRSDGLWPHLTGLHEIGHPIELKMLDENYVEFSAALSPELEAFRRAVDNSPTIQNLRINNEISNEFKEYHEIFARAFAQYIAVRTGDKVLMTEINKIRKDHPEEAFKIWEDKEFQPIAAELDRLFEKKGLK